MSVQKTLDFISAAPQLSAEEVVAFIASKSLGARGNIRVKRVAISSRQTGIETISLAAHLCENDLTRYIAEDLIRSDMRVLDDNYAIYNRLVALRHMFVDNNSPKNGLRVSNLYLTMASFTDNLPKISTVEAIDTNKLLATLLISIEAIDKTKVLQLPPYFLSLAKAHADSLDRMTEYINEREIDLWNEDACFILEQWLTDTKETAAISSGWL